MASAIFRCSHLCARLLSSSARWTFESRRHTSFRPRCYDGRGYPLTTRRPSGRLGGRKGTCGTTYERFLSIRTFFTVKFNQLAINVDRCHLYPGQKSYDRPDFKPGRRLEGKLHGDGCYANNGRSTMILGGREWYWKNQGTWWCRWIASSSSCGDATT